MNSDSLRERQLAATKATIIEAYLALAHAEGASAISMPAVADASGVSVRTVYRYFASKEELVTAAAHHMSREALAGGDMYASTEVDFADNLKMLWVGLNEQLPAVVAEHATPAGREIRRTRLEAGRETVARELSSSADQESVDLVVAVTSSSMFLELVDRMGYAPEVAAAMAARVARLVLDDVTERSPRKEAP